MNQLVQVLPLLRQRLAQFTQAVDTTALLLLVTDKQTQGSGTDPKELLVRLSQ